MMPPIIVDAHSDLAWNMLNFGRDYTRAAADTRAAEQGTSTIEWNGNTLIGWPDYQRGRVAVVFSTLFAAPKRLAGEHWEKLSYANAEQAHQVYRAQLDAYHRLSEESPEHFRLIRTRSELDDHMRD